MGDLPSSLLLSTVVWIASRDDLMPPMFLISIMTFAPRAGVQSFRFLRFFRPLSLRDRCLALLACAPGVSVVRWFARCLSLSYMLPF